MTHGTMALLTYKLEATKTDLEDADEADTGQDVLGGLKCQHGGAIEDGLLMLSEAQASNIPCRILADSLARIHLEIPPESDQISC